GVPVNGTSFIAVLKEFNEDPETLADMLIGEIGGTAEQDASQWIIQHITKDVTGFIGGSTADPGKRMRHAATIKSGGEATAKEKNRVMTSCGIKVAESPAKMEEIMISLLDENNLAKKCKTH